VGRCTGPVCLYCTQDEATRLQSRLEADHQSLMSEISSLQKTVNRERGNFIVALVTGGYLTYHHHHRVVMSLCVLT